MAAPYDEVVSALAEFFRLGAQNGDWAAWAELFTDDAEYIDHRPEPRRGRRAISEWIIDAMAPVAGMTHTVEWSMVDGDRVAFWIWNHLPDPGGTEYGYDYAELSVLTYAGAGKWLAAEEFSNPDEAVHAVADWKAAGGTADLPADHSLAPAAPSHPRPPAPAPDRAVLEAVCDALVTENWLDLIETSGADWHDHGGYGIQRWADGDRVERYRVIHGSRAVIALDSPVRSALVAHVNEQGRVTYLDHVYDPQQLAELSSMS